MQANPLITIMIPTYNVESEYLIKCLDSVICQSYNNIEILIIDDNSSNRDVLYIIDEYKQKDNRITLVKKNQNDGVSITRKQGAEIAKGEYIMYLDCDDFLVDDCIELLLNKSISTDADIVIGDFWMTYETFKIYISHSIDENDEQGYLMALLTYKCGGTIWAKLIKKDLINKIPYPTFPKLCNDVFVNFHIAIYPNINIVCLKKPVYNWVQRETSVMHTKSKLLLNHDLELIKEVDKLVENHKNSEKFKKELMLYKLGFWSLLLSYGIEYNSSNKILRKEIYSICMKNKWAMSHLKPSLKMVLMINRYMFTRFLYLIYMKTLKIFLKNNCLKLYKKIFK